MCAEKGKDVGKETEVIDSNDDKEGASERNRSREEDNVSWIKGTAERYEWLILVHESGKKSKVWKYFTEYEARGGQAGTRGMTHIVRCKVERCCKELAYGGRARSSATGMIDHLSHIHNIVLSTEDRGIHKASKRDLTSENSEAPQKQTSMEDFVVQRNLAIGTGKFTTDMKNRANHLLLEMIVTEFLPFNIVEKKSFKKFIAFTCNPYELPSRKYISDTLLQDRPRAMDTERAKFFATMDFFSLTIDEYSAPSVGRSFIA
ncbi:unnamed protein product [Anisakis simplex]|uniref:BED-type domain-containing protein n=1 Tax=Anisakis simplex TaxID=6269 RepID=A0A0M3J6A5_ANISI|nr:unnamed protein product [Anisakis simplex]